MKSLVAIAIVVIGRTDHEKGTGGKKLKSQRASDSLHIGKV